VILMIRVRIEHLSNLFRDKVKLIVIKGGMWVRVVDEVGVPVIAEWDHSIIVKYVNVKGPLD
jgi:hypothetical protein